jgi:hypothetical protein
MNCSPELRGPPGRHFPNGDLWSPHRPSQPPSTGWSGPRSLNMSGRENPQPAYNYPTTRRESHVWQTLQLRSRPASRHESLIFSGPRWTASQRPPDAASCRLWGRQHFPMVSFSRCAYRGSLAVLRLRDLGSGAFLTPGSGIRDEKPGSYFQGLRKHFLGLKYLNSLMRIRDPGWKKFESGMGKIRIRDKNPRSATLITFFSAYFSKA